MKTIILIPARMASSRFPNKPMAIISGKPMIERVWRQALLSKIGDVIVACCEKEVFEHITKIGGKAVMTDPRIASGTDRIYEVAKNLSNINEFDSIINLQGDMPIINHLDIEKVNLPLKQGFEIGTLSTQLKNDQLNDENVTKVKINWIVNKMIGEAEDFFKKNDSSEYKNLYHHVGIYSFRLESLKKFVSIAPTDNEINLKLEQLRAIDSKMTIGASYVKDVPISVDTKEELIKVEKILDKNNEY